MSKEFQSSLRDLLGEISRSHKSYSGIADSLQESLSADIPPITLPDAVLRLMGDGVIPNKVAYTQEDLLSIVASIAGILVAVKSASEVDDEYEVSLPEHIAHYQQELSLKTNEELRSYDLKDPFMALSTDAERYALAMVLDDMATDRKIVNKPYLWRTILDNRGKL